VKHITQECERKSRYSVRGLIEKYGRDGHMQLHDRCDLGCPDLPKVL
jgi:hypothetical protein